MNLILIPLDRHRCLYALPYALYQFVLAFWVHCNYLLSHIRLPTSVSLMFSLSLTHTSPCSTSGILGESKIEETMLEATKTATLGCNVGWMHKTDGFHRLRMGQ